MIRCKKKDVVPVNVDESALSSSKVCRLLQKSIEVYEWHTAFRRFRRRTVAFALPRIAL
tara:strand:+ start:384 stop:560 length:177 start_codon:yes stop_codon:yes gene_type:complete